MIQILDKSKCSGCSSCMNICPVSAIEMFEDEEGFIYPRVDVTRCIDCGCCDKVCPFNDEYHKCPKENRSFQSFYYAAQLKKKAELKEVSSGGAFWGFAQAVLMHNGVIYGAVQKNVDEIYHIRAERIEDAKEIRRSKYLPSKINRCFQQVKNDLRNGKMVLFSGTGCQIAGLNGYLGKTYKLLYTCEVVCHGIPSLQAWRSYKLEHERMVHKSITDIVFRDKTAGWSKNQYKVSYSDGTVEYKRSTIHTFHSGYLQGLFYRPSCGQCPFALTPRVADITLADYWQYKGRFHSKESDLGVSLISINNDRGLEILKDALKFMEVESTSKEKAFNSCKHLNCHPIENPQRQAFIDLMLGKGYHVAAKRFIKRDSPKIKKVLTKLYHKINKYANNV